ncbi:class F sortase [Embleya scabrispora]|uniref:class F sortase n=1 Tax=Embleya scabrispora TaxID=159449 RepID=UPI000C7AC1E6|nr:class F sortase [Embleya scabrispora]
MADTSFVRRVGRRLLLVVAVAAVVCGVVLGVIGYQNRRPPATATAAPKSVATAAPSPAAGALGDPAGSAAAPAPPEGPILARSEPVTVDITEIGVHAPVTSVGLDADGAVQVPPAEDERRAGWYDQGPTPGELGPAVLVGHLDSAAGPAVFYEVGNLRPGATVEIRRADQSTAIFTVDAVERFTKTDFPTQRVYGDLNRAELRVITCGGDYDADKGGYQDNTILFAHLTGSR